MFNYLFDNLRDQRYQQGYRDRGAGLLPRRQDTAYLSGYLADRPNGLDNIIQHFPTLEAYLEWKQRSFRVGDLF